MGKKTILVTGAAGSIGYHLCEALLKQGHQLVGLVDGFCDRLHPIGEDEKGLTSSQQPLHVLGRANCPPEYRKKGREKRRGRYPMVGHAAGQSR